MDLVRQKIELFSVTDILYQQYKRNPDREAVIYKSVSYTYDSIFKLVCNFAKKIDSMKITSDNVGIIIPRSLHYIISYFAVALIGKVIVPLDPALTINEIANTLEYCDVDTVICDSNSALKIKEINGINTIVISEDNSDLFLCNSYHDHFGCRRKGDYENTYILLHTSGSINAPKRVMLSHKNVIENAKAHALHLDLKEEDRALIALPMYFGYCNTAQIITHFLLGGTLILLDGLFSPHRFLAFIDSYRISVFTAVPTMLSQLVDHNFSDKHELSSLRQITFGGAPMPSATMDKLKKKLKKVNFCQTYGLTEAGPRISAVKPANANSIENTVGNAIPGVKLKVVNKLGEETSPFSIGEIIVQSPGMMKGYYKLEEETNQTIINGFLHTGDLGYVDDSGNLFLVGRLKNIIIRGGINIYPEEIESYLLQNTKVKEVLVYGKDDSILGEIVHAKVVRKDATLSLDELLEFARKGLTRYKIPVFEFVDSLPRTYNNKIKRLH
ncbi:class I adenylate-forming enzyme family protein [Brevibacillus formosus]|uniref:class I adenylate-forming enzyme family protein n=1 Tax=Brevibacillus formosus TaxID=54913 RepID=UPI0018CE014E|nr:class I adenylate-forming enzyme family protein [Brevibacillus formosus]MBG9941030.1 hypothetical protein [Brevibacillus formosus]